MTRGDLVLDMLFLREHMIDVAAKLDYYGGFDGEAQRKADELLGASQIVRQWAQEVMAEA